MTDYIAFEGPAWAWILAITALVAFGGICAALLTWALGLRALVGRQRDYEERIATADHVDDIAASLHRRVTKLEQRRAMGLPQVWPVDDEVTDTMVSKRPTVRP